MNWLTWPARLVIFVFWFAWAVITSNATVVRDLITPGQNSTPGIVALATRCGTNLEITLLGAIITLTPGTLTMGMTINSDGTRLLFVHGMYHSSADDLRQDLTDMEAWLLWAIRRRGLNS